MPTPTPPKIPSRLLDLIEATLDGNATSEEFAELSEVLEQQPEAVTAYIEYVNLHSFVRQTFYSAEDHAPLDGDAAIDDTWLNSLPDRKPPQNRGRLAKYMYAAIAATLLLAFALQGRDFGTDAGDKLPTQVASSGEQQAEDASVSKIEQVAVLTRLVDVVWNPEAEPVELDQPLTRRRLEIASGLVQLEFYCGAVVIMEGPASFELLAPDRGFAHHGKLRAYVPVQARGFTIGTEKGDVVDLGTEFGINISPEGRSELHVLDGEVDFHHADTEGSSPHRLVGGQAIDLNYGNTVPELLASNAQLFTSYDELEALANLSSLQKYRQWTEYRAQLREDPALLADYLFEGSDGWGRELVNAAPNATELSYGAIVGASWQQGRWSQTGALDFDSPSDRIRINLPGEYDALTMATWIKVRDFEGMRDVAILNPEVRVDVSDDELPQRFVHWTLDRISNGAILHFSESVGKEVTERNHFSSITRGVFESDYGKWIHLSVVYDPDNREVRHYKDGQLIGAKHIANPRKVSIGVADLGNWPYKGWARGTQFEYRNLNGAMDEFVVLTRALADEEIQEMYEVGQPR